MHIKKYLSSFLCISSIVVVAFLFLTVFTQKAFAAGEFITTWKTDNPGITASNQIRIPTAVGPTYNYTVNWGDASTSVGVTGSTTHTYAASGTYTVTISGTFPQIFFESGGSSDAQKLLSIEQWGTQHWTSMYKAFAGAANMVLNDTVAPDLSGVTDVTYMFLNCTSFNTNINNWDMSHVTTMPGMLQSTTTFNQPLNTWDVSHVTEMQHLFDNATLFNQDISGWDVSHVQNMGSMFQSATHFNQSLNAWGSKTASVTDMGGMFYSATAYNQSMSTWDVSHVTNMSSMFRNADAFNSNTLSSWNTSSVTNMSYMFAETALFNRTIRFWDVTHVTDMSHMFDSAIAFNQDLHSWYLNSLTNASYMFYNATSFNEDIHWPSTSSLTNLSFMFAGATSFNGVMHGWDTSHVTNMESVFSGATAFDQYSVGYWDTSSVTNMGAMFAHASSFNQDITGWDISHVTDMSSMFYGASAFDQPLNTWGPNLLRVTTMAYMFADATSFDEPLSTWNVSAVTNMDTMFGGATSFDQNLSAWKVSSVSNMNGMMTGVTLSTANYDALLSLWSALSLQAGVTFVAGNSAYCSSVTQRASIIAVHGWTISDGGTTCHTLTYGSGIHGSVSGTTFQYVANSGSGLTVTAVPMTGYQFASWSDASTQNPRTDTGVTGNISVTASFSEIPVSTNSGGGFTYVAPVVISHGTPRQEINDINDIRAGGVIEQSTVFTRNLRIGSRGDDVKKLQQFLNTHGFVVAKKGNGSVGKESTYYGTATAQAIKRFQEAHGDEILKPVKLKKGNGIFGSLTRKVVNNTK